jgi:hypothetical protein
VRGAHQRGKPSRLHACCHQYIVAIVVQPPTRLGNNVAPAGCSNHFADPYMHGYITRLCINTCGQDCLGPRPRSAGKVVNVNSNVFLHQPNTKFSQTISLSQTAETPGRKHSGRYGALLILPPKNCFPARGWYFRELNQRNTLAWCCICLAFARPAHANYDQKSLRRRVSSLGRQL